MQTQKVIKAYLLLPDDIFDKAFLEKARTLLDKEIAKCFEKKRLFSDRLLSVLSHLLVRKCVFEQYGVLPKKLVLLKNEYGKPCFSGFPDIHFNISHTEKAILVAVSDENVGVDIEKITNARNGVAQKYFTDDEKQYCQGQDARFFEIWTKKEAYAKYTGKGLIEGFSTFSVLSDKRDLLYCEQYGEYMLSVCSKNAVEFEKVDTKEFKEWIINNI